MDPFLNETLGAWLDLLESHWSQAGPLGIAAVVLFYFTPSVIVYWNKHPNRHGITAINLIFGWTIIGWIVAFFMANWKNKDLDPGHFPGQDLNVDADGD